MRNSKVFAILALFSLAACGGGSGSGGVTPRVPSSSPTPPSQPNASSNLQFSIAIPAPPNLTGASRKYVSPATQSAIIGLAGKGALGTFDLSPASSLCKAAVPGGRRTCTIGVTAPVGNDTFTLTTYDRTGGSGNVLASGTITQAVSSTAGSPVNVSLTGAMAQLRLNVANPTTAAGTASSTTVSVQAIDADGSTIIGPYDRAVTLQDTDPSGHTTLSATTLNASTASVTLKYDGAPFHSSTISASAPNMTAPSPVTFTATPTVATSIDLPIMMQPDGSYVSGVGATGILAAPDGNLWVAGATAGVILKITPSGSITPYWPPTQASFPQEMVFGADGAIWFTETQANNIGRIALDGTITEYPVPTPMCNPLGITLGPDGNVWFAEQTGNNIAEIDTSGNITEYPLGSGVIPNDLTTGPDGNLWVDAQGKNSIMVVSPTGTILATHALPATLAEPYGIIVGPDKNLWFGEYTNSAIARMTPQGTLTVYPTPSSLAGVVSLAVGPDGNIWFAENSTTIAPAGQLGYITPGSSTIHEVDLADALHTRNIVFDNTGALWYTGFFTNVSHVGKVVW